MTLVVLAGCTGSRPFHDVARAGDTVAIAAGWKHYYSRDNITVTITPSSGSPIVLAPNDPAVRAVVNLYPDPISSLLVSQRTGQDLTPAAQTYAWMVGQSATGGDADWWQTTVFVDLPVSLPAGTTTVEITNPQNETVSSEFDIVPGTGQANPFEAQGNGPLNPNQLASMERIGHYTLSFSGSTIPFAIQIDLVHNPDMNNGGSGKAYVVNPRGDLKNVAWKDDGTHLRMILTPASGSALNNMKEFKCYVAGGVTGLLATSVKAFDINGNPVSGVTATVMSGG